MAANKPHHTLADYVAIGLSPVLIMALVGSLVFFLLKVLYEGPYESRLQWILFWFVFGAVLIARISMHPAIADRAGLYGLILAVAIGIALYAFVRFSGSLAALGWAISLAVMALIW